MSTWADTQTEINRLHKIPGVVARRRPLATANDYNLRVKDGRLRAENDLLHNLGQKPGSWRNMTIGAANANLSKGPHS